METEKKYDNCESCPAGGRWPWYGPGLYCFGWAYFYGKARVPVLCAVVNEKRELLKNKLNGYQVQKRNENKNSFQSAYQSQLSEMSESILQGA